jgi:hypothetical protein
MPNIKTIIHRPSLRRNLPTAFSYTITASDESFSPPESCVTDSYTFSPEGYDVLTTRASLGTVLSRGIDTPCYPPAFRTGVVYSPAVCPMYYSAVHISTDTYDVIATTDLDFHVSKI